MSQKLTPLIALQKLDLRIMEITEQRRKIPEQLHAAEAPVRELMQVVTDTKTAMDALSKERRGGEKDLEAHEAQTDKMKSHAASLKTNKEYQAHLFEIELANKKRGEFEEKILVAMEKIEHNKYRVVIVVDGGRVVGIVADGDLRRAFLHDVLQIAPVSEIMQLNPRTTTETDPERRAEIVAREKVTVLPVVDEQNTLIDVALAYEPFTPGAP